MDAKLQRLFDEKHKLRANELAALDAHHRHALGLMIRGQLASPDRVVAMDALMRADPHAAKDPITEVLHNRAEPVHLRAAAAIERARIGGDAAEDALIDSLDPDSDELLQIEVASALGRVGRARALATLAPMAQHGSPPLRRQARLGLLLAGLRQAPGHVRLPMPAEDALMRPRDGHKHEFQVSTPDTAHLDHVLSHIALDSFGLTLSNALGYEFACGRNRFTLMFDEQLIQGDMLAIMRGSCFAGVLAHYAEVDDSFATRLLMLTGPGEHGNQVRMSIYRTNGALLLTGPLAASGEFELFAVRDGANTPVHVAGRVRSDGMEFRVRETEVQVQGQLQPVASSFQA